MMSARLLQGPVRLLSTAALIVLASLLLVLPAWRPSPADAAGAPPSPAPSATPSVTSAATPSPAPAATATPSAAVPSATTAAVPENAPAAAAAPVLSVQVAATPATIARAGQTLTYTVTVKNTGNGALRAMAVSAVAPGLETLTCAPVAQGATLYTATSTTCTASRASTGQDLRIGT
ncbi:MAG TPA: hypothetical protein VGC57_07220, partial [Cellulomonas sp.]